MSEDKIDPLYVAQQACVRQMKKIDDLTQETFDLKKQVAFLKESRSRWAKQSSDNADLAERQAVVGVEEVQCPDCGGCGTDCNGANYEKPCRGLCKGHKLYRSKTTLSHEGLGREEIRTLWEYADHKGDCRRFDVGKSCSCGFDSLSRIKGSGVSKRKDKDGLGSLLWAVKLAYRKFHLDDDALSEREVCGSLCDALCNEMGDNGFQDWLRVNSKRIKALKQLRGGKNG